MSVSMFRLGRPTLSTLATATQLLVAGSLSFALLGCGGGNSDGMGNSAAPAVGEVAGEVASDVATPLASATTILVMDNADLPVEVAAQAVQPSFHLAPVQLDAPADVDVRDSSASARLAPSVQTVPAQFAKLSTERLTLQSLRNADRLHALETPAAASDTNLAPMATASAVTTYTPAQIRAAYGFAALPASTTGLTATQAAQLGAGQTIYIVDAMHNPNVAAELAAFNTKFGLPGCTTKAIASTASLPLAAASGTACELSVVYATPNGTMTSTAPAYNAGWATEIAMDVQWAHATAPLARIVLIEAPDASLNSLLGGIKLANRMGPGIVSMSFGTNEGSWTSSVESVFTTAKMTYLAAAGDSGTGVMWPAVSPNVVAVGGTSLTYTGTSVRSEVSWSGTGGGTSAYTAAPAYQTSAVPGMGTVAKRNVPDVALNADPATGQYVAVITPGSSTVGWASAGGTSISAPQWAGVVAVANATRALSAKAALGAPHSVIYGQISTVPGTYASGFADIVKGANGACGTCSAKLGFDPVTGLGTPNVNNLVSTLAGLAVVAPAPVVTPAAISGKVGTALSFTASVAASNPVTYSLTGAPAGMAISGTGVVTWATPVAGSYAVTVTAKDSKTGLSGNGVYTVTVAAATAPTVGSATIAGKPGTALSFAVSYTSPNPVAYTLNGAPAGMSITSTGVVSWASPVLGTYSVTVTAKDSKTGLNGSGVYTVKIATAGPVITASAMTGVAGKAVASKISITDPGAAYISVAISGVPLGMAFSMSGMTITATWNAPTAGNYSMKITVTDSAGLSAQATVPITIAAK